MSLHRSKLVVIEAGALELPVVQGEAERLDQVQPAAGVGGKADDVAGVRRNFGMDENDVEHQEGGSVRATTQFTTREAPARLSVRASSSSVAPVVMTSSTTATVAPTSGRLQRKAPRTLRWRSSQGSCICGAESFSRTHRSTSSLPGSTWRAISTAWL